MKRSKFYNLLIIALALTVVAGTGCKRKPTPITPLPNNAYGRTGDMPDPNRSGIVDGGGATGADGLHGLSDSPGHVGWNENTEAFKAQTVYFDFDSAVIKRGERSKIEFVADYLKSHGNAAVRVEGNCDERGTEEYNRALGERRALAAREELIKLGIAPDRVDTISFGKDRPAVIGNNEAAYSKNRRDEFVLLTPPGSN